MRCAVIALLALVAFGGSPAAAQTDQTLADIRQELSVLYVEVQRLKRELSTTGAPSIDASGNTVLDRMAAIEAEMQRLTAQTEQLELRVNRVVTDGTNRFGDLEFRLVELEGGDVSKLGEVTTLGGTVSGSSGAAAPAPAEPVTELAVGEQADFDAATQALDNGDYAVAAALFDQFNSTYPGSPLAPQVFLGRGRALDGLGDTREAARAYLASFSADANSAVAAEALASLGGALGRLGQTDQACVTLAEVSARFPQAEAVATARKEMASLGCG